MLHIADGNSGEDMELTPEVGELKVDSNESRKEEEEMTQWDGWGGQKKQKVGGVLGWGSRPGLQKLTNTEQFPAQPTPHSLDCKKV